MQEKDIAYVIITEGWANFEQAKQKFQDIYKDWREAHKGLGDEKFRVLNPYLYEGTWEKDTMSKAEWIKENVPSTYLNHVKDDPNGPQQVKDWPVPQGADPETFEGQFSSKVIVKPTNSFGSAGVKVCDTRKCVDDQIKHIFEATHDKLNIMEKKEVIVEGKHKLLWTVLFRLLCISCSKIQTIMHANIIFPLISTPTFTL
jgi:hypothetical protein